MAAGHPRRVLARLQTASGVLYAGTNGTGAATLVPVAERETPVIVPRPRAPRPVDPR